MQTEQAQDVSKTVLEYYSADKFLTLTELEQKAPEFYSWLESLSRYSKSRVSNRFQILYYEKDNRIALLMFTRSNEYHITAVKPSDTHKNGYLGCIASSRINRAGETWSRCSDLPDGDYSIDTFRNILSAIVAYELVELMTL